MLRLAVVVVAAAPAAAAASAAAAAAAAAAARGGARGPLSSLYAPRRAFGGARNNLLPLPPMGFMTWELFRCGAQNGAGDDGSDPLTTYQISSALIRGQAQAMSVRGFTKKIARCYPLMTAG